MESTLDHQGHRRILSRRYGKYLFPCNRSPLRGLSDNALNGALRHLGFTKDEAAAHGFRASARTILDEVLKVRPAFIKHQLSHSS